MSHSYKHNPFTGWHDGSDKKDKAVANRRRRRKNRERIACDDDPLLDREAYDVEWNGTKDGKGRFDPIKYPEFLRK
jgi:hypothetical protein